MFAGHSRQSAPPTAIDEDLRMPMLNLSVSLDPSPELAKTLAAELTRATSSHLQKDPSVTAIAITPVDTTRWFIGGDSVAAQQKNAFWLDIKVTAATNTKAQYADYLAEVFATMQRLLGPLHETSYIVIDEVSAPSWGYAGISQEQRFVTSRMKPA